MQASPTLRSTCPASTAAAVPFVPAPTGGAQNARTAPAGTATTASTRSAVRPARRTPGPPKAAQAPGRAHLGWMAGLVGTLRGCRLPLTRGGETVAISLSLVGVLAVAVWVLHRYAGMKIWHGLICVLFGFFLASSSFAPQIRTVIQTIIQALTGHH
jgi:hypothetical protein